MTIIEVLIVSAGLAIFMGLVYRVYAETRDAAIKMTHRQSAIDYAVRMIDEVTSVLLDAVDPESFDEEADIKLLNSRIEFKEHTLTIPRIRKEATEVLCLGIIRPVEEGEEGEVYEYREEPIKSAGPGAVQELTRTLGGRAEGFTPELSFRYATEAQPGQPVTYVSQLEAGQWPVLIQVSVSMEIPDYPTRPVEFQTAVIPGRLPRNELFEEPPPPEALPPEPGEAVPAVPVPPAEVPPATVPPASEPTEDAAQGEAPATPAAPAVPPAEEAQPVSPPDADPPADPPVEENPAPERAPAVDPTQPSEEAA